MSDFDKVKTYGENKGIEVFPGMEVITSHNGFQVDLIAIGFDPSSPELKVFAENGTDAQRKWRQKQVDFILEQGYVLNDVEPFLSGEMTEGSIDLCRMIVQIPENENRINQTKWGYLDIWNDIRERFAAPEFDESRDARFLYWAYFAFGRPGNFTQHISTEDLISRVHAAGGVVLYSPEGQYDQEKWKVLKDIGIDGIMGWHADELADAPIEAIRDARKNGLLVLGGSDYQAKDWEIGVGKGEMFISPRRSKELKSRLPAA